MFVLLCRIGRWLKLGSLWRCCPLNRVLKPTLNESSENGSRCGRKGILRHFWFTSVEEKLIQYWEFGPPTPQQQLHILSYLGLCLKIISDVLVVVMNHRVLKESSWKSEANGRFEVALVNYLGGDHKTAVLVLLVTVFTWRVEVLSWWTGQVVELVVFPAKKVQYILKSPWLKDSSVFDLAALVFYQGGVSECSKSLQVQKLASKRVHKLNLGGVIGGAAPPSPQQRFCQVKAF